jgi:hypothetical protein
MSAPIPAPRPGDTARALDTEIVRLREAGYGRTEVCRRLRVDCTVFDAAISAEIVRRYQRRVLVAEIITGLRVNTKRPYAAIHAAGVPLRGRGRGRTPEEAAAAAGSGASLGKGWTASRRRLCVAE